jgi:hypothetical protein
MMQQQFHGTQRSSAAGGTLQGGASNFAITEKQGHLAGTNGQLSQIPGSMNSSDTHVSSAHSGS